MALFTAPIGRLAFPGLRHEERVWAPSSSSARANSRKPKQIPRRARDDTRGRKHRCQIPISRDPNRPRLYHLVTEVGRSSRCRGEAAPGRGRMPRFFRQPANGRDTTPAPLFSVRLGLCLLSLIPREIRNLLYVNGFPLIPRYCYRIFTLSSHSCKTGPLPSLAGWYAFISVPGRILL